MNVKNQLKIDGIKVKLPHSITIEDFPVTKSQRLENGDMSMDFIAWKNKLFCTWKVIDQNEWEKIYKLLKVNKMMHKIEYVDNGKLVSKTMYMGSLPRNLYKTYQNELWVYTNVKINFIEQ